MYDASSELLNLRKKLAFAEQLLTGVARANDALINIENYRESIQKSLELLGNATEVDRVYIFEWIRDPSTEKELVSQRWEWVAPGVMPEIDNPELQNLPIQDILPRWCRELPKGREISGLISQFPASERSILESQNIISIVVVPIMIRNHLWGFMGFDDCHQGHAWSSSEINALKTVANSFGGSFARQAAETELKQVNESLEFRIQERTAELEESTKLANSANRAKSDFLANMSHELRTPLNGILGYAQILKQSKTLTIEQHTQTSIIEQCGQHLLMLINDVLDLAKIESRKMELYPSNVHLEAFVRAIIETFNLQAQKKGIGFYYSISPEIPDGIQIDKKRLRQVLFNLIANAIKFTEKGSVEVRVIGEMEPNIINRNQAKKCRVFFEICDTGPGIKEEEIENIFKPFEQVGSITKRSQGTGLGLAISQKILSMMGSRLDVESTLGKGSKFFFEISCPEATLINDVNLVPSNQRIIAYKGARQKILIVDDHWENRAVLNNMLRPLGFQILEAENGAQGLEKALAETPALIITDVFMPVMNGYEFMKLLRQQSSSLGTKIIVSSASVFQTEQQRSLDAGGDFFIAKPVQLGELLQTLQSALKLKWIYEELESPSPPPQLKLADVSKLSNHAPPLAELMILQKLALSGLIQQFCRELDQIDQKSTEYRAFTQEHREWAANFKLQEIKNALEVAIAQTQAELHSDIT